MLRVLLEYLSLELNFVPDGILESKFNISIFFPRFNLICVVYCNTPRFSHELDITKDKHHNTIDHFIDHHDNFGSQNHWWPMKSWHTSLTQYTNLHKHTYINYIYTYIDTYIGFSSLFLLSHARPHARARDPNFEEYPCIHTYICMYRDWFAETSRQTRAKSPSLFVGDFSFFLSIID